MTLADDVAAAVEQLRRERAIGVSEAVNELVRRGLVNGASKERERVVTNTYPLGVKVDVSNVGEVLAMLDEEEGVIKPW